MMPSTLAHAIDLYRYYKSLGEKSLSQTSDEALNWIPDEKSNSINVIIRHLHGNMMSRWTDFLTTDGEKEWRQRDQEFEEHDMTRDQLMQLWEEGWTCLFNALTSLTAEDMEKTIYIRNMGQSVEDAIMRQLAHYSYHVGQIVYLARLTNNGDWQSLTIPRGNSDEYNKGKNGTREKSRAFHKEPARPEVVGNRYSVSSNWYLLLFTEYRLLITAFTQLPWSYFILYILVSHRYYVRLP
jgi:hypothetical protein